MKTLLVITLFAIIWQETSAQDLSSFYAISGFKLPALHSGQYYLSLSPRYSSSPRNYSSRYSLTSPGNINTDQYSDDYTYSTFGLSTNFTYGISDATTISLGVQYNPNQTTGNESYSGVSTSTPSYTSTYKTLYDFKEEIVSSSLLLSHRFQSNIEFSVSASWWSYKYPHSGSVLESSTDSGVTTTRSGPRSGTSNQRYIDINATIVILGY